jgi:hypothetical protein
MRSCPTMALQTSCRGADRRTSPVTLLASIGTDRAGTCNLCVPLSRALACAPLWRPGPGGIAASRHRGPHQGLVTTLRTPGDIEASPLLHPLRYSLGGRHGWVDELPQQLSTLPQGGGFAPIGQQAVMAYADKPCR